jgi:hypothetical protein
MDEEQLWNWMMQGNYPPGYPDMDRPELTSLERRAVATLSQDVEYLAEIPRKVTTPRMRRDGELTRSVKKTLKKGSKVKVVMASRMGDVGITPSLNAHFGYCVRIQCVEGSFAYDGEEIPLLPEKALIDITPIEDPREDKVKLAFPEESTC